MLHHDTCPKSNQPVLVIPLKSEMALLRRKRGETRIDHVAIVGFRSEQEARNWRPHIKHPHLRLVGPFLSLVDPACRIGCCP